MTMRKPRRLHPGDTVAVVSLSWGGLGDPELIHKYHLAKERLETLFGLHVRPMPHALKGSQFVYEHPELRAQDLMDAFRDSSVQAVFSAIGGDDSIRLLPYVDWAVLRDHPKIFMGYSDTTVTHFLMHNAGVVSFYGPSVMCEFGEYGAMFDYTVRAVRDMLFGDTAGYRLESSPLWSAEGLPWEEKNLNRRRSLLPELHGYELLQGSGIVQGRLLGGCLDVFPMCVGTAAWPAPEHWDGALLFLETSEDKPAPDQVKYILRNLAAQGIFRRISGILVGKPQSEVYYEAYKQVFLQIVAGEEGLPDLPILYNLNFGHAAPIGILPCGIKAELDCAARTVTLLESAVSGP